MLTVLLSQHKGSVTLHDGKKCFIALTNHGFHWPIGENFWHSGCFAKIFFKRAVAALAEMVLELLEMSQFTSNFCFEWQKHFSVLKFNATEQMKTLYSPV